jgi:hypothetical protein
VLIVLEVPDTSPDVYDRMTGDMPSHVAGGHPGHDHAVAVDGDTLVVADIWPSMEAFGQFAEQEIGPAASNHGMRMESMTQRVGRVHNRILGRSEARTA